MQVEIAAILGDSVRVGVLIRRVRVVMDWQQAQDRMWDMEQGWERFKQAQQRRDET